MSADDEIVRRAAEAVRQRGPLDAAAMAAARSILDGLTKPPGSLGRLESIAVWLAGVTGTARPAVTRKAIVVAAADHGVTRQGVSAYPADVTPQMVANFLAGGAAINVLAARAGADVIVVDVGVASAIPGRPPGSARDGERRGRLLDRRLRRGTDDLSLGPAMSRQEAIDAVRVGLELVDELRRDGVELLGIGEMGIGNTTSASAVTAALTGAAPAEVTGRGTGIDDATHRRKIAVVEGALRRHRPDAADPIGVLAAVGGLEIGALVGVMFGAVAAGIPVVLDGFITGSAALLAAALAPGVPERTLAAHRSLEPGHAIALDHLGLDPLLHLELRLGEGTGAALAFGLIDAAIAIRDEMATFESAGVSGPAAPVA